MTKREARKVALRHWAAVLRSGVDPAGVAANLGITLTTDDLRRVQAASDHLADHLEWEAEGRRTALK